MGFNALSTMGSSAATAYRSNAKLAFGRLPHEMTTAQESESGSHFDRDVRSIVVGGVCNGFWAHFPIEARAWRC
jgi:hypothetical protein